MDRDRGTGRVIRMPGSVRLRLGERHLGLGMSKEVMDLSKEVMDRGKDKNRYTDKEAMYLDRHRRRHRRREMCMRSVTATGGGSHTHRTSLLEIWIWSL